MSDAMTLGLSLVRRPEVEARVRGAALHEELCTPYRLELELDLADPELDPRELVAEPVVFDITRGGETERVHGLVTHAEELFFRDTASGGARLVVEPALALARLRRGSRIFQGQTVPEILEQVLGELFAPLGRAVRFELSRTYLPREYTLQYLETDDHFVHRLLEEEGLVYVFDHEGEAEELVVIDRSPTLPWLDGHTLHFGPTSTVDRGAHVVSQLTHRWRQRSSMASVRSFDWTHPSHPVESQRGGIDDPPFELEVYQHEEPITYAGFGHSYTQHDVPQKTTLAAERLARDARTLEATSPALGARAGRRFALEGHLRPELDREYLITQSTQRFRARVAAATDAADPFVATFRAMPAEVPWRPSRERRRTPIDGPETATVVGPPGEEIHPDVHGRVKVQFHWDRVGQRDEHASCWIRVMQAMGGSNFGFAFVPRIGMEVVVSFVEGDPDRPLITGVVYNGANPPPYDYPADKTRTTIKTLSSPGGEGFNELRLEDRAGQEEVFVHAQKDWNTWVLRDANRTVDRDEEQRVGRERERVVERDETITVESNREKRVDKNEDYSIGRDRRRTVGGDETVTVGGARQRQVGQDESIEIAGNAKKVVVGTSSQAVSGTLSLAVAESATAKVAGSQALTVAGDQSVQIAGNLLQKAGGSVAEVVGDSLTRRVYGPLQQRVLGPLQRRVGANAMTTVVGARTVTIGSFRSLGAAMAEAAPGLNDAIDVGDLPVIDRHSALSSSVVTVGATKHTNRQRAVVAKAASVTTVGPLGGRTTSGANVDFAWAAVDSLTVTVGDTTVTLEPGAVKVSTPGTLKVTGKQVLAQATGTLTIESGGEISFQGANGVGLNCS